MQHIGWRVGAWCLMVGGIAFLIFGIYCLNQQVVQEIFEWLKPLSVGNAAIGGIAAFFAITIWGFVWANRSRN